MLPSVIDCKYVLDLLQVHINDNSELGLIIDTCKQKLENIQNSSISFIRIQAN